MRGVAAQQQVIFGAPGEQLTIRHDTIGQEAYETGILLSLRAAASAVGVIVGLDNLIDLGIAEPSGEPPRRTVRDAGNDGTDLTR
jgi:4-hydroxy-tetrahydrodipicolinate reductase